MREKWMNLTGVFDLTRLKWTYPGHFFFFFTSDMLLIRLGFRPGRFLPSRADQASRESLRGKTGIDRKRKKTETEG